MQQGTREWLDARIAGIGGSEAAALYNKSPWISQYGLWARKTGRLPVGDVAHPILSPDLYWGHKLEDDVRETYAVITGRVVGPGVTMLAHPEVSILLANTDGEVSTTDREGPGVYEGKTALGFGGAAKWKGGSTIPVEYMIQVQHYLACTGLAWAAVAVFLPNEQQPVQHRDVERDDRFIDDLLERAQRWWTKHVVRDVPPEPDGSSDTSDALSKMWPDSEGDSIHLGPEFVEVARDLLVVRSSMAALARRKKDLENRLRAAVGSAPAGELPDGTLVEVPTIQRKAYAVEASCHRQVRIKGARPK